jgi:hypothetical protein
MSARNPFFSGLCVCVCAFADNAYIIELHTDTHIDVHTIVHMCMAHINF